MISATSSKTPSPNRAHAKPKARETSRAFLLNLTRKKAQAMAKKFRVNWHLAGPGKDEEHRVGDVIELEPKHVEALVNAGVVTPEEEESETPSGDGATDLTIATKARLAEFAKTIGLELNPDKMNRDAMLAAIAENQAQQ
jgi:hypothetical protein